MRWRDLVISITKEKRDGNTLLAHEHVQVGEDLGKVPIVIVVKFTLAVESFAIGLAGSNGGGGGGVVKGTGVGACGAAGADHVAVGGRGRGAWDHRGCWGCSTANTKGREGSGRNKVWEGMKRGRIADESTWDGANTSDSGAMGTGRRDGLRGGTDAWQLSVCAWN